MFSTPALAKDDLEAATPVFADADARDFNLPAKVAQQNIGRGVEADRRGHQKEQRRARVQREAGEIAEA